VPFRVRRCRAREQLVPGAAARSLAVHDQRQRLRPFDGEAAVGKARGERGEVLVQAERLQQLRLAADGQARRPVGQAPALAGRRASRQRFDDRGAHPRGDGDIRGLLASRELVPPGFERIDPGGDAVAVSAGGAGGEAAAPAVVAERLHLGLLPRDGVLGAPAQHHAEKVVAVGEAVGLHDDRVSLDALDREAAAVHAGSHGVDDRARAALGGQGGRRLIHGRRS
jgi:hypothetical protein